MDGINTIEGWFRGHDWSPFEFQYQVWNAYLEGKSGLVHSATGTGKTFAAWLGPIAEWLNEHPAGSDQTEPLRVLWITPLRALAADTIDSLKLPISELQLPWLVEGRTGDTSTAVRARQKEKLPTALVTTPESLTLMLSQENASKLFSTLRLVVIDEWHELMSTKRGVQTELALARIRKFRPDTRVWGLSATLGNLDEAMKTLTGVRQTSSKPALIEGKLEKQVVIDSVLPHNMGRFPWAGHLGKSMIPPVIEAIEEGGTCLVFCNTRSQCEIWYQAVLDAKPEWADTIALHHGSLDRAVRDEAEAGLKDGRLRAVFCTSSLDLGVDFSPVDRVLQVGSPKSVARLLQRAGRSGHRPGVASRVTCVPTHAFELVDIAAARVAAEAGRIETREGLSKPLDVLTQHLVTIALGGGFRSEELFEEVRTTFAYQDLSREEWEWSLEFVVAGGKSLRAYPEYHKLSLTDDGLYCVEDAGIARRHRMSIGTIVSDAAMHVRYMSGGYLGTIEESFLSRLKRGDRFIFAGKPLEFVRIKDMTAWVKPAKSIAGAIPRWQGGRLPLSSELSHAIRQELELARHGQLRSPEMEALADILETQASWSVIPAEDEILIERVEDKDGHHLFIFPFEGRLVHEGLSALFAYRIGRLAPLTFTMACNDYGLELLSTEPAPLKQALDEGLFSNENLAIDIPASLNAVEMARRRFREVARIAGLIFTGYPGQGKSAKQIQASSSLFYDVFARYDPENLLLHQANREVLELQLEQTRMFHTLIRLSKCKLIVTEPPFPTPMAFPILVDHLRETLSTESLSKRIERLTGSSVPAA